MTLFRIWTATALAVAITVAADIATAKAVAVQTATSQINQGRALFGEQCATCHGSDARGLNGPNLIAVMAAGATDDRLLQTMRSGVPGTAMPPSRAGDDELGAILAYLKSLAAPPPTAAGVEASARYNPSRVSNIVTLAMNDGRSITGERRNEDAFSIQVADARGRLQGFFKHEIKSITRDVHGPLPAADPLPGVAYGDILEGLKNPQRWLTYSGDYTGRRHSPLTQITQQNVARLKPEWTFQTGTMTRGRGFEATPLLWDGVLYVTGSNNFAWALDARTGRPFWSYRRDLPNDLTYGAQAPVNRGFALLDNRLFMVTLDAHLLAFDRATGRMLWDIILADYKIGYSSTLAPLAIENKVIVGISGGEYPTRGFIDAYDPATGKRLWRFNTIPNPGEKGSETWPATAGLLERGGGTTWMTGTYDPELNMLYWGTGNPNPDYYGADRKGDNLYTNSLVALDAATGALKWHYQFTPHDTHDWDANQVPVLADWPDRKVVMQANRNGFFYVLDRKTGELIFGKPFTDTTWAREIGKDGRPIVLNEGDKGCIPDMWGGTNFNPPTYDPALKMIFINTRETCATYEAQEPKIAPGRTSFGGVVRMDRDKAYGALRAIDATTGDRKWEFKYPQPTMAGVLSTASGLVFAGDNEGNLMAFDAKSGKNLWRYSTGTPIWGAAPMTYMLDGKQHIVVASGTTLLSFVLP